jgi:hypothetical protein
MPLVGSTVVQPMLKASATNVPIGLRFTLEHLTFKRTRYVSTWKSCPLGDQATGLEARLGVSTRGFPVVSRDPPDKVRQDGMR